MEYRINFTILKTYSYRIPCNYGSQVAIEKGYECIEEELIQEGSSLSDEDVICVELTKEVK